jgi:hypothetical protein
MANQFSIIAKLCCPVTLKILIRKGHGGEDMGTVFASYLYILIAGNSPAGREFNTPDNFRL